MFDSYAKQLIDKIPKLPGLDHEECRREISKAYIQVIKQKTGIQSLDEEKEELNKTKKLLRRLSKTLESHAIFDAINGITISTEEEESCCFVAAEALSLLIELVKADDINSDDPFVNEVNYMSIEASLLYMVGGYDINATSVIKNIKFPIDIPTLDKSSIIRTYGTGLMKKIINLCTGNINVRTKVFEKLFNKSLDNIDGYDELVKNLRIHLYDELMYCITEYMKWLGGNKSGKKLALDNLKRIIKSIVSNSHGEYTEFADIYVICNLLVAAIIKTSGRSTVHSIPEPSFYDEITVRKFRRYLKYRAVGKINTPGRPFLWPSALDYIKDCLPGPSKNAVVAMPTGSGKSFIAELAIVNAVYNGWVLYLVPTNALAHQIRRDLKHSFEPLEDININSFVGGDEYTTLSGEQISNTSKSVVVMTPEKCSLALRLYPDKFVNCSLCVFDECHLLNDTRRGITADLVLAQLFATSPNIRFLLMSAMISNAMDLSDWLKTTNNIDTVAKEIKWRPSRTIRGLLVLDKDDLKDNFKKAKEELKSLGNKRKNVSFESNMALIAGLSGPWTNDGPSDYSIVKLPIKFISKASKLTKSKTNYYKKTVYDIEPNHDGWKNTSSRQLSEFLARKGISVINFILTSRHHAFGCAEKTLLSLEGDNNNNNELPDIIKSWLNISNAELGVETRLWDFLRKDISVHTSAMLQTEQAASEWMFAKQKTHLMFATGTLAQGLNLPAVAVVISGTSMGDPRDIDKDTDKVYGINRINSLILNGFGRAGRPGFSNQGIGVLVSDRPYYAPITKNLDPSNVLESYGVLSEQDAAITIKSPVEKVVNDILNNTFIPEFVTNEELNMVSMLAELNDAEDSSGKILSRTLGGFKRRNDFSLECIEKINQRFKGLKNEFIEKQNVPEWINTVAMKAGVDFLRASEMWNAYKKSGFIDIEISDNYSVNDWLDKFFETLSYMKIDSMKRYIPENQRQSNTVLDQMKTFYDNYYKIDKKDRHTKWKGLWKDLREIVLLYMSGETYANIAKSLLKISNNQIDNRRSDGSQPIPFVFKFIKEVIEPLSIDAGCFLALNELGIYNGTDKQTPPEVLQALPLCIKNGCNSLETLAWFRFGIRQRVSAHTLQKVLPIPDFIQNDSDRLIWVRDTRRLWLGNNINLEENELLKSIQLIIKNRDLDL
jgi:replicative superfamily II helicase